MNEITENSNEENLHLPAIRLDLMLLIQSCLTAAMFPHFDGFVGFVCRLFADEDDGLFHSFRKYSNETCGLSMESELSTCASHFSLR